MLHLLAASFPDFSSCLNACTGDEQFVSFAGTIYRIQFYFCQQKKNLILFFKSGNFRPRKVQYLHYTLFPRSSRRQANGMLLICASRFGLELFNRSSDCVFLRVHRDGFG